MLRTKLGLEVDEVWLEGVWDAHDNDGSGLLEGAEWVKLVAAVRAHPGRLIGLTVLHNRWNFYRAFWCGCAVALNVRVILTHPCIFCMDNQ